MPFLSLHMKILARVEESGFPILHFLNVFVEFPLKHTVYSFICGQVVEAFDIAIIKLELNKQVKSYELKLFHKARFPYNRSRRKQNYSAMAAIIWKS